MVVLLSLTAAAALLASTASAATSGDFNILSFNVAGLPAILNDNSVPGDKATNAGTIGTLFAEYDYDVIHVQEDMYSSYSLLFYPKANLTYISTTMPISMLQTTIHSEQPLPVELPLALASTLCRISPGSTSPASSGKHVRMRLELIV